MKLTGRILWLTNDATEVSAQLAGTDASFDPASPPDMHYGVNTDAMISGAACTLGYTGEILGPYFLHNFKETVSERAVLDGGFQVVVGGDAYGSGSSREVAVVAHQGAGIELVVARSFQRIFQENMVYSGLPFTTDYSVVDRLQQGEDLDLRALSDALPPFFEAVAKAGGLLQYGSKLLAGEVGPTYETDRAARPMNCIEKIVAQKAWVSNDAPFGIGSVGPGDQVLCEADFRGMHEYTAGMVMALYADEWGDAPVVKPELAAAFEDHFVLIDSDTVPLRVKDKRMLPARKLTEEMVEACEKNGIRLHGPGRPFKAGVCHRIVVEDYARPGDIIVLTDSHTPTAGVLNAFAFGVGSTAMSFALRTGLIPVTVPKTIRVLVSGDGQGIISPKDLVLHLIGDPYFREEQWRESATDTCVIQLGGPGLDQWNVDELSVITNMTVEGGLMTGVVEPCAPLRAFLSERRGDDMAARMVEPDPDAEYVRTIEIDLADVPITVATPGDSRNRVALSEVGDVPVHNVVIASCTVKSLGAVVSPPGCGSCIGNGPGIPFEGETTASTTNRNFDRRMGAPGPVYLVSPAVAAASAVAGRLTDPRTL
jgi:3-isopropylmalate/(R)-2-methylmalate dehydratase large subunit